jgi:hypothetical protein
LNKKAWNSFLFKKKFFATVVLHIKIFHKQTIKISNNIWRTCQIQSFILTFVKKIKKNMVKSLQSPKTPVP